VSTPIGRANTYPPFCAVRRRPRPGERRMAGLRHPPPSAVATGKI